MMLSSKIFTSSPASTTGFSSNFLFAIPYNRPAPTLWCLTTRSALSNVSSIRITPSSVKHRLSERDSFRAAYNSPEHCPLESLFSSRHSHPKQTQGCDLFAVTSLRPALLQSLRAQTTPAAVDAVLASENLEIRRAAAPTTTSFSYPDSISLGVAERAAARDPSTPHRLRLRWLVQHAGRSRRGGRETLRSSSTGSPAGGRSRPPLRSAPGSPAPRTSTLTTVRGASARSSF